MKDLITVIVPVYNCENYIGRCLDSIIAQTYNLLEIILVDDGATDSSGAICDEYAKKDNRIKVIHQENAGSAAARNSGIDIMTGKYLVFIDSDDYVAENYIEVLYNNMSDDVDMVVSKPQAVMPDGSIDKYWPFNSTESIVLDTQDKRNMHWQYRHFWIHNVLFRTDIIGDTRLNRAYRVSQDTPYYCHIYLKCKRVKYIPDKLYYYVIFEESACHGKFNDKKFCEYYAWNEILEIFKGHPLYEDYLSNYVLRCYRLYIAMLDVGLSDDKRTYDLLNGIRDNLKYGLRLNGYPSSYKRNFVLCAFTPKAFHKMLHRLQLVHLRAKLFAIKTVKKIIRR